MEDCNLRKKENQEWTNGYCVEEQDFIYLDMIIYENVSLVWIELFEKYSDSGTCQYNQ